MEKKELKTLLRNIKDNKYAVPEGVNPYKLSLELMDYIGDIDGELRNDLIYSVLVGWIMTDVLTFEEAHNIFMIALDEKHILNGLGEINDTVFGRTFSVEVAACIIYKHRKLLSDSDILKAFNAVLKFYNEDRDVRGFVEGKSWAHGAAHGADALMELAQCEIIGYEGLKEILDSIHKKIKINYYGYINNEDERMISAVKAVLERDIIPVEEIKEWIRSIGNREKEGIVPDCLFIEHNVILFLKSLYFRLVDNTKYDQLAKIVKEVLKETSRFGEDYS
ncbi:Protein of unknown function [Clostridium collagenovorans DSM 3089]|uniref:DUF2785 domain-containing protein n=1 Tax=Clostridium collagenovorans DSM 3089 TaxID=1121306 RepID=A0A1M5S2B9_9CLOT|nr:DUF2785 domain-containing protein [Clostridium collagenovorans]SHH32802.1 Protein of unknown function [Clostridium collagenovorans DSM 3089]